jgi:MaoC like domain
MTESFDRRRHRFGETRYFEDLAIGERFYIPSRTMTEAHFAAFQTVSADNHPIHYDVEYCRERGHKGPLAHGFQILSFIAAGAGTFAHQVADALIAFIEQSSKFVKPVLRRGHALPDAGNIGADTPALDRRRDARGDHAQPEWRTRPERRAENPAAQAASSLTCFSLRAGRNIDRAPEIALLIANNTR